MTARAKPHPLILTFASSIPPLPPQPTDSTPITPSCFHQHEKRTVLGIYSLLPTVTLFSLSKKLVLQMYDPNQWFKIHFLVMYTFALSGLQNTVLRTTVTFFFFKTRSCFHFATFGDWTVIALLLTQHLVPPEVDFFFPLPCSLFCRTFQTGTSDHGVDTSCDSARLTKTPEEWPQ